VLLQHVSVLLAVRQRLSGRGIAAQCIERLVHHVDIKPEHGQFRCAEGVRQPDGVREAGADVISWDHDDVSVACPDALADLEVRAISVVAITVVMAEHATAGETITGHHVYATAVALACSAEPPLHVHGDRRRRCARECRELYVHADQDVPA
jgi:hypothetical protein